MAKVELTDDERLDFIEELLKNAYEVYNDGNIEETALGCLLVLNNVILYLRRLGKTARNEK